MAFEKDWRQKRVIHRTPGGKMTRVKISSLPAKEQHKYNPNRYKRLGGDMAMSPSQYDELQKRNINPKHIFDLYVGVNSRDDLDLSNLESGDEFLVYATNDASSVEGLFGDSEVATVKTVPVDAIKGVGQFGEDGEDSLESIEFKELEGADEEKFGEVKFGDSNVYKVDLGEFKDVIEVSFPEDDTEDSIEEGFYNFYYRR